MKRVNAGFLIELAGDHRIHTLDPSRFGNDLDIVYDEDSFVYTVRLSEEDGRELYFRLQKALQELMDDRR